MKTLSKALLFGSFLGIFFVFACSSKGEEEELTMEGPFNISELAGSWNSTSASFVGNTSSVNVVGDGGTLTMTVQSNGRFSMNIDPVDQNSYSVSGKMFWEKWEGEFYFAIEWDKYSGDWDTYGATLIENQFTLNGGGDSGEYDFDGDGSFESASISITFERI